MISLRTNVPALGVTRTLDGLGRAGARQLEQLSSGLRINRASDDAAGLVNSEALRAQANGARVAGRNVQDGVSVLQTAEGALGEVSALLQRMRDLGVQAANTGAASLTAREAAHAEFAALG